MVEFDILQGCRDSRNSVVIFLVNGFQLKGTITRFDDKVVVLTGADNNIQMIYKSAISTIVPH